MFENIENACPARRLALSRKFYSEKCTLQTVACAIYNSIQSDIKVSFQRRRSWHTPAEVRRYAISFAIIVAFFPFFSSAFRDIYRNMRLTHISICIQLIQRSLATISFYMVENRRERWQIIRPPNLTITQHPFPLVYTVYH